MARCEIAKHKSTTGGNHVSKANGGAAAVGSHNIKPAF